MGDEEDLELPNLGDDRPGLDDLDDPVIDEDADDDDYPEDAGEDDIDFVVAAYREDGQATVTPLDLDLANDLDSFINHLRRIPGEAGALGMVSIASEMFALVRVRGRHVQVLLSDLIAAADWPIARDIVDYLGVDLPEEDEDGYPVGDLDILADAGLPDFELESLAGDYDADTAEVLEQIATKVKFGPQFVRAVATFD